MTRLPSLTLSEVSISGGETVSHESVRAVVERELEGSYLVLIPRRFALLYPKESIKSGINNITRVHNVVVERVGYSKLQVTFDEYVPHALLCDSDLQTETCYFLDRDGYSFSPAPPLRGGAFVRHVVEGIEVMSAVQAIDTNILRSTDQLIGVLGSEFGFRVIQVMYDTAGDITYHISGGGKILVTRETAPQEIFENLQSVLQSAEFDHIAPGNFNYIDLRFGNKVFVNEELDVASTTEEVSEDILNLE